MNQIAALLLLMAIADAPVAKIEGPDHGRPGDIIILSASEADHTSWAVDASEVQVPVEDAAAALMATAEVLRKAGFSVEAPDTDAPPVYLELDGGKRLLLASYPGVYRLNLAVSNADGVSQCAAKVTITGKVDPPKPPPKPDVDPVIPPGKFGLGQKMYRAAMLVQSANRPAEAKQIAAALLMSAVAADGQAMIDAFATTMKTKFTADQKAAWEPWRQSYLAELSSLQQANKLVNKSDWVTAFGEMAVGLSAVEK